MIVGIKLLFQSDENVEMNSMYQLGHTKPYKQEMGLNVYWKGFIHFPSEHYFYAKSKGLNNLAAFKTQKK